MKFLEISTCCCCIDLRTGCLILGYLTATGSISIIADGGSYILYGPSLVLAILMIYGIHKNRSNWILPSAYLNILALLLYAAIVIAFPIIFIFLDEKKACFHNWLRDHLRSAELNRFDKLKTLKYLELLDKWNTSDMKGLMIGIWFALAIVTVLQWYFTAVIFSMYKSIKNDNERQQNAQCNVAGA